MTKGVPVRALVSALARMQSHAFWNSIRRGKSRDPLPLVMSILVSASTLLGGLAIGFALFFAFASRVLEPQMGFWIITVYGFAALLFITLASISGESGGGVDARSLQIYPIARPMLVLLDLVSQILSPSTFMFVPGFSGVALGVLLARLLDGHPLLALPGALGVLAALFIDLILVRVASAWISAGGRRFREWALFGFLFFFVAAAYLTPELDQMKQQSLDSVERILALVARVTWFGAAADLATAGSSSGLLLDALIIAAWGVGLFAIHGRLTEKLLDSGGHAGGSTRRRAGVPARALLFIPGLPQEVLGVASADFRSLMRIPTMWVLLFLPALFGVFIGGQNGSAPDPAMAKTIAEWTLPAAAVFSHVLFSSQLFANLFGTDGDAAALFVLAPAPAWKIFLGKALARLGFGTVQMLAFLAALSFRTPGATQTELLRAWFAWFAVSLWAGAVGLIVSVRFPVRMTFGKVRDQRFERVATALFVQAAIGLSTIPGAAMVLGGRALAGNSGYLLGTIVTVATGFAVWGVCAFLAGELFAARGERMVEDLSAKG